MDLLGRARRDFGGSDKRIASDLVKRRVFRDGIRYVRSVVFPVGLQCPCCKGGLPRPRSDHGKGLPYLIREAEEHWLSQHLNPGIRREYSEALFDLRRALKLERRWENFIRICIWFDSPSITATEWDDTDIPSPFPIQYDFVNWNVAAVFEGTELDRLSADTLVFCRTFARWRNQLLKEQPLPARSRKSFNAAGRDLVRRLLRQYPDASDADLNHLFHSAGGKDLSLWAFQKLRQTVLKRRSRRSKPVSLPASTRLRSQKFPAALKPLVVTGRQHLQSLRRRARKGK